MKAQGKIQSITKPIKGDGYLVTVRIDALPEGLDGKLLDVTMTEHKSRRSNDANALMWACIGEIARAVKKDPFEVYLDCLKKYGLYSYVVVPPQAVDRMIRSWRLCEVVGDIDINGRKGVQLLCFFGSSMFNTKEMSDMIEGILMDMADLKLQRPASSDIQRAIAEYERRQNGKRNSKEKGVPTMSHDA